MTPQRRVAVGIDVGGTFTDLVSISADGAIRATKVLSNPVDRAAGVLVATDAAALDARDVAFIAHGTTVVTNLLLERRGARVLACTTAGFTDVLELRRQERASLYDLTRHHTPALVSHAAVVGVRERMVPEGVLLALSDAAVDDAVREIVARSPETVAITFLHAYADGTHERQLRDAVLRALPECDVICSHEVLPEIREYERMATTVAEAYARPAVRRYMRTLGEQLAARALPMPRVMTSAGGTLSSTEASVHAASLALSGPAGGVTGAAAVVRALGFPRALTIDIGGTSADVGLIDAGEPLVERGGDVAGVPIALPRVLVEAVAAGGGSIGWIDAGGALRAGPQSAGASPGPAAYGTGGAFPTVTDAHVVLGHVAAGRWSGGVSITASLAEAAMTTLSHALNVTVERAATALIATADATMARALRRVSVERGVDPRDAVLVAFGGGGPLHACGLAEQLGMTRIVVPPHAGVLSAIGLALAPERREGLTSYVARAENIDADALARLLANEAARLRGDHGDARVATPSSTHAQTLAPTPASTTEALTPRWWARARYEGQGYEVDVPITPGDSGASISDHFIERHRARAGFVLNRAVECISIRTALIGTPWPVQFMRPIRTDLLPPHDTDDGQALERSIVGPAVVKLPDATMRIADGWTAHALPIGGWLLERT